MKNSYTIIPDYLMDLDLNLTEIVALATIAGFCQDGESDFHGSYSYLARKCKIERRSAMRVIARLVDKGLISKTETITNGVKSCSIRLTDIAQVSSEVVTERHQGGDRMAPGVVTECHQGGDRMSPGVVTECHPKINIDNKEKIKSNSAHAPARARETFIAPNIDEVSAYFNEKGFKSDPVQFWTYWENHDWVLKGGRKMKDWQLAAINWESQEEKYRRDR